MRRFVMLHLLFGVVGGAAYVLLEQVWRGYSHWSMFFMGGICFVAIGLMNEVLPCKPPLLAQMAIGAVLVTVAELAVGLVANVWLGMNLWDYSQLPLQVMGQICLPYSCIWFLLSGVASLLEDLLHALVKWGENPK